MISNFKFKISNSLGITLVEIIVVIFLIGIFSVILVADFPVIQRKFALSRATYKLGQDIRRAEDLSLSGVQVAQTLKGYGIYLNLNQAKAQYLIYADVDGNQMYNADKDFIVDTIDISKENSNLIIKRIDGLVNFANNSVSINFTPPDPSVKINNIDPNTDRIGIVLGLVSDNSAEREIWVNRSGLVEVK